MLGILVFAELICLSCFRCEYNNHSTTKWRQEDSRLFKLNLTIILLQHLYGRLAKHTPNLWDQMTKKMRIYRERGG